MNYLALYFVYLNGIITKSFLVSGVKTTLTLPQGKVQGSYDVINKYYSFFGIPFASLDGRFQEPGDPPLWNGTLQANEQQIVCKQFSRARNSIMGKEDCLTLNVYTSTTNNTPKLPVIFFIHGGGFYWGRNVDLLFNPKYLLQKNVVVVNINYRVGAFGFLCLHVNGAPGNVGLKDQIAALKWVQNNIASFGGNPDCVTLFGQNAGAASVNYLILSRKVKGLFHRAIMDSGTVTLPYAYDANPVKTAADVAERLGYNTTDPDELLKIFLNSTADDIVKASYKNSRNDALAPYTFRPCAESTLTRNPIITDSPEKLLRSAELLPKIEVIIGYNNKEGIMWTSDYDNEGLKNLDVNFSSALPDNLKFRDSESKFSFIEDVKKFYFNNSFITINELIKYFSDALIMYPTVKTMEQFLKNPRISMYNYYFQFNSFRNLNKQSSRLPAIQGANNADELFYLFDPLRYRFLFVSHEDQKMIELMTSLWSSFAYTGIPITSTNVTWKKSEKTLQFLKIDQESEMIDLPNSDRIQFWKDSIKKYTV